LRCLADLLLWGTCHALADAGAEVDMSREAAEAVAEELAAKKAESIAVVADVTGAEQRHTMIRAVEKPDARRAGGSTRDRSGVTNEGR
jgi:NAD(P)-dependent dehydrogenase (short-subunit alcohol dehydrogenase family)